MTEATPFAGLRVIDFTHVIAGPLATLHLAVLGADVVKIEPPGRGDQLRRMGGEPERARAGMGAGFLAINSGKRSLALDLKQPAGREAALRLLEGADVVVENFRPGVMERLGLGVETVRALQSRRDLLLALRLWAASRLGRAARLRPYRPGCGRRDVDAGRGGRPAGQDRLSDGGHRRRQRRLHRHSGGAHRAPGHRARASYRRLDDRRHARHDGDAGAWLSRHRRAADAHRQPGLLRLAGFRYLRDRRCAAGADRQHRGPAASALCRARRRGIAGGLRPDRLARPARPTPNGCARPSPPG